MLFINKSTKLMLLTVAIIFLLFFLHLTSILRPVENAVVYLTRPLFSSVYAVSQWIGGNYLNFKSRQALLNENQELKDQLIVLLKEKSRYLIEAEENEFLNSQLKFTQDKANDFEVARVIGQNLAAAKNSLLIDKGEKNGLAIGQPVLGEQSVLIGKIYKVNNNSAIVLLINDDLSKISAKILNHDKTMGIVEGEYGLGIRMKLIPQSETVEAGDLVITSGLEKAIPKGLVIGQIKSVNQEPEELFKDAAIATIIDFNKIILVNIIK